MRDQASRLPSIQPHALNATSPARRPNTARPVIPRVDTDGNHLRSITHPDLTGPQGVAFDDRGHLFSASFYQDQIVEFDPGGNYVRTITDGGLDIPRSMSFIPVAVAGDTDGDGDVDLADYVRLIACVGQPGVTVDASCGRSDLDDDGDVDLADVIGLQALFTGPR